MIYETHPGRLPALNARFKNHTVKILNVIELKTMVTGRRRWGNIVIEFFYKKQMGICASL